MIESLVEDSAGSVVAVYIDSRANSKTGTGPGYDAALSSLRRASDCDLSPIQEFAPSDSLPKVQGVRNPAFVACQDAMQDLLEACSHEN